MPQNQTDYYIELRHDTIRRYLFGPSFIVAICAAVALPMHLARAASVETTLYSFPCYPSGPATPFAGLTFDSSGNLYGAGLAGGSVNLGAVFSLVPPAAGSTTWSTSTLYSFSSQTALLPDASSPHAALLYQKNGTLFGTGYYSSDSGCGGNGCGGVYELSPPAAGQFAWSEKPLYIFSGGSDGENPAAALVADQFQNLYGTTMNGGIASSGTVFELVSPGNSGGPWTEQQLWSFDGAAGGAFPSGSLYQNQYGSFFGTTQRGGANGGGTVFELTPPATRGAPWTQQVLYSFLPPSNPSDGYQPVAQLVADSTGALFGTTQFGGSSNRGTVFKLAPPISGQSAWAETTLYSFHDTGDGALPSAGLFMNSKGVLFGTSSGTGNSGSYGTIFKLTPPASGSTAWKESTLYKFTGGANGEYPISTLVAHKSGALFGTAPDGGGSRCGIVFEVTP